MFLFPAPRSRLSPLWIAGAFLAALLQPAMLSADELTAQKKTDIRRLMEVTGGANVAQQFASASSRNMFQMLKSARPDIPDRALEVMDRELTGLFKEKMSAPDGLFDQIVPIYHRHMTHAEIRQLIAFYETPIGRKTVAIMPQVVAESMQAGQRWGMSLGPEIERRIGDALVREGLIKPEDPK